MLSRLDVFDLLQTAGSPARCAACHGAAFERLCDSRELARQQDRARDFHRRRLVRSAPAELEERAEFTQDYDTNLIVCRACGLLARHPHPDADALEKTYGEDRYAPERLDEMIRAQLRFFRKKARGLADLMPPSPRIVELGSFVGGFLEACRERNWDALGIDPGHQVTTSCRKRGLDVFCGTLEDAAEVGFLGPADALAIWNTFDQIPDPGATIRLGLQFLRPGGLLILRVPHGLHFQRLHPRSRSLGPRSYAVTALLAWNNLLGFPYLHGHGIHTFDRLILPFGFERVRTEGDVLIPLAGRATARWARVEERFMKAAQRGCIALQSRNPHSDLSTAPWLDVVYRRSEEATRPQRRPLAATP